MIDGFTIFSLVWIVILLLFLIPIIQRRIMLGRRLNIIRKLEKIRKSKIITLIHRQERMSILGITLGRFIDMEDSEQILTAIRRTPRDVPIDIILHTPGGIVIASQQIALALKRHPARVTVLIPHYAMSGGTLVALAADEIFMDTNAVIGPVDPQMGSWRSGFYPAASILKAVSQPNTNRDDQTLILADIAQKAINQVRQTIYDIVQDRLPEEKARDIAAILSEGRFTHDYPIGVQEAVDIGLPVKEGLPGDIYKLMSLYPQGGGQRPSVEYVFTDLPSRKSPEK
jgi:ClpP class serine protease